MQTIVEKAGKKFLVESKVEKNALWSIEVVFSHGAETKIHRLRNLETKQLMDFRADVFAVGLMYPVDPGHWVICNPVNIISIDVYKQNARFADY